VLERFQAAQIPALPVKGIVSAHTLYDDVADRLLTDVDLKIRPRDFDRVLAVVAREGWRTVQRMRAYGNVVFVVDHVYVDIEGYLSSPGLSHLSVDVMIARARASEVLGFPHLLPDFHDHAVVLLLNVFKDKLIHAFAWAVRDLERLPSRGDFDPVTLASRLDQVGASTIGWIVADWMVRERRVSAWSVVRNAIGEQPRRRAYVELLARLRKMQPRGALALRVLSRAAADRPVDRVHALARLLWFQGEVWASKWGDTPFHRQNPAHLEGTVANEMRADDVFGAGGHRADR
jgi:hypothetical protein